MLQSCLKMREMPFQRPEISKFPGGACPRTPLGARAYGAQRLLGHTQHQPPPLQKSWIRPCSSWGYARQSKTIKAPESKTTNESRVESCRPVTTLFSSEKSSQKENHIKINKMQTINKTITINNNKIHTHSNKTKVLTCYGLGLQNHTLKWRNKAICEVGAKATLCNNVVQIILPRPFASLQIIGCEFNTKCKIILNLTLTLT